MYMEPVTLALIVILLALWLRWRKKQLLVFEELGILGPKPNIICGNMYSIVKKGPLACWKEWAQKYGKVYGYYFGFKPVLYVGDTDLLKKIQIKDFQHFMDRPIFFGDRNSTNNLRGALTNEQSKRWKELRSILTPSFTTARMRTMVPLINNTVKILISNIDDKVKSGEEINVFDCYQKLTLDVIGRAAFGISSDVQKEPENRLLRLGRIVFSASFQSYLFLFGTSFPELTNLTINLRRLRSILMNKGKNPASELMETLDEVIQERRRNPELRRADILQLMLDAEASTEDLKKTDVSSLTAGEDTDKEDDTSKTGSDSTTREKNKDSKHLDDQEVKVNALVFFLAGYETTSNLLTYATYLLAKHPEVQEKVRREVLDLLELEGELDYGSVNSLKYLDQVISESLRLYPPIIFFVNREALTDVEYGNLRIPKGMAVQVPVYDLHHSPEHWTSPEEFIPERFAPENRSKINNMAFQPFGLGPRNCIGMRFAQMEAKIALAHVLRNFYLKLSPRYEKAPLKLTYSGIMKPADGVYVTAEKISSP